MIKNFLQFKIFYTTVSVTEGLHKIKSCIQQPSDMKVQLQTELSYESGNKTPAKVMFQRAIQDKSSEGGGICWKVFVSG